MNLIAKGNTAEVFDYAEGMILKLFYSGYAIQFVRREQHNAQLLYDLKLPVPKCYDLISINDRHGILYEKIEGTDLVSYLMDGNHYNTVVSILTKTHKEILQHEGKQLPTYKDFVRKVMGDKDMELLAYLGKLPDGNTLCHGDFHPGNVLIDRNGEIKVIDFMNICCGPKDYDIARTYYLMGYSRLPKDIYDQSILTMRKSLAQDYLEQMGKKAQDIAPYLPVIEKCNAIEVSY